MPPPCRALRCLPAAYFIARQRIVLQRKAAETSVESVLPNHSKRGGLVYQTDPYHSTHKATFDGPVNDMLVASLSCMLSTVWAARIFIPASRSGVPKNGRSILTHSKGGYTVKTLISGFRRHCPMMVRTDRFISRPNSGGWRLRRGDRRARTGTDRGGAADGRVNRELLRVCCVASRKHRCEQTYHDAMRFSIGDDNKDCLSGWCWNQ